MTEGGTIAAWAALVAALLALVVALAQAAQQYAATAQDMKKCERSVWGPMPGYAGRRVFLWRQIRFRIVFDVPNIFIPTEYWDKPGNARQFPTHRITTLPAPFDPPSVNTDTESTIHNHSEACWVSFARQVSHVCPSAVRVGLMAGDADRLPADIPVVPMQVSLRDITALGLMIGMRIQAASEDRIEMIGPFGFIKSRLKTGDISKSWLRRLIGIASVAKQQFDEPKRRSHAAAMMRWRTNSTRTPLRIKNLDSQAVERKHGTDLHTRSTKISTRQSGVFFPPPDSDKGGEREEVGESQLKFVDLEGKEHTVPADKCSTWQDLVQFLESNGIATAPYIILGPENEALAPKSWEPLLKVVLKGDLKTIFKIVEGYYPPSTLATPLSSQEPSIKGTTDQQTPPDTDNVVKHANRTPEGSAGLAKASERESTDGIPRADSPVPDRDISLYLFPQGDTMQNTIERDGYFPSRCSSNPTNQTEPMQTKDSCNGKEQPAETWAEDGVRGESSTNESRVRVPEAPPPIRIQYRRPTVEDYRNGDSRSPSPRFSHWFSEENRNRNFRRRSPSSSPHSSFSSRFREENRNRDSRSPSLHSESSFDSEREWRDRLKEAYDISGNFDTDPPLLTFYWASQIDIELGCWATPWLYGMFTPCVFALGMMVDIGLAGLSQTSRLAQPKANRPAVGSSNEIIYAKFPGSMILQDLWAHLREGEHTWPPYATNARGGVRGLAPHSLIQHSAFRNDERLPQLTLLDSVHEAQNFIDKARRISTAEANAASQVQERDRILELASIDFWLSHAAATNSISEGKSNLVINTPAIVEEIWLEFCDEIMDTRKELWNPGDGDVHVRKLANYISDFLCDSLGSPAEIYFVWVAFLRAVKVLDCIAYGPTTYPAMNIFKNDILVYLV